jgi:hypothetical protein
MTNFHCFKLFHLTLFMAIYGYFQLLLAISPYVTFNYSKLLLIILGYFILA